MARLIAVLLWLTVPAMGLGPNNGVQPCSSFADEAPGSEQSNGDAGACSSFPDEKPQASKAMLQIEHSTAKEQETVQLDTEGSCPIRNLKLFSKKRGCTKNCPGGWRDVTAGGSLNGDLNQAVGGKYIYLAYQCCHDISSCRAITGLVLTKNDCPSGYTHVEREWRELSGDLNQGAGGTDIYLCQKTGYGRRHLTGLRLQGGHCGHYNTVKGPGDSVNGPLKGDLNHGYCGRRRNKYNRRPIYLCTEGITNSN